MKTVRFFFMTVMIFFAAKFCHADTFIETQTGGELFIFTLQNGMTIFFAPDSTSALVRTELVFKAGYSNQTSSTAGFFPSYVNLFETSAGESERNLFSSCDFFPQCNADSANFRAEVPAENLEEFLSALKTCAASANFSDEEIQKTVSRMKAESFSYAQTTAGFINSAIDSRIFSSSPWKHESGINPAIFSAYSTAQFRSILYNFVGANFYTPKNCALFLSGNVSKDDVVFLTQKIFSSWNESKNPQKKFRTRDEIREPSAQKKFVLTDDSLSPDFTQIAVQFTSLEKREADLVSAAFANFSSAFRTILPAEKKLCIPGGDYVTSSAAGTKENSRLILQSLMETSAEISAAEQAELFVAKSKECAEFLPSESENAKSQLLKNFRMNATGAADLISALAEFWAAAEFETPEKFYDDFLDYVYGIENFSAGKIAQKIFSEEPFVFVLVNKKNFEKYKDEFSARGFETVTRKNSSWYADELFAKISEENDSEKNPEQNDSLIKIRPGDYFYFNNLSALKTFSLDNGIPAAVKENPKSATVAFCISIQGGKFSSPDDKKKLRSMLVSAVAKNSAVENLQSSTGEFFSRISGEVLREEFFDAMKKISDALIFGNISPVKADILFKEENYGSQAKKANLCEQMKNAAFSHLYRGTPAASIFSDDEDKTSYESLLLGYTEFLDASLYSVTVAGGISKDEAEGILNQTMGILRAQKSRESAEIPQPNFKGKEKKVSLRHTFQSDLPAEKAPKESPRLVPTKNFSDPAQIYFLSPQDERTEIFNALILELESRMKNFPGEKNISSQAATHFIPVGMIQVEKISRPKEFFDAYKKSRAKLLSELDSENSAEKKSAEQKIKILWKEKNLRGTKNNSGTVALIQDGLDENDAAKYLKNYLEVENSSAENFKNVLEEFFPDDVPLKVYSADAKK
jgi:zinc protease